MARVLEIKSTSNRLCLIVLEPALIGLLQVGISTINSAVHPRKKEGGGAGESNRRKASPGEAALGHAFR